MQQQSRITYPISSEIKNTHKTKEQNSKVNLHYGDINYRRIFS
jgi:hypothetical protein